MVQIDERTVRHLSGERVAVGNIWQRSPEDGGRAQPGARLFVGQAQSVVVFEGSVVEVGGTRWRVVQVHQAAEARGFLGFEPA